MMRKTLFTAMLTAAAAWAWAAAPATQPAATQPAPDRIAALIAQMGDPAFASRAKAQKELIAIGPAAEPALRDAATHSPSAEIRARAKSALDSIDANGPDSPTWVTIDASDQQAGKILATITEKSGAAIAPWNSTGPQYITLNLGRVPLLVALEKFCNAAYSQPACENIGRRAVLRIIPGSCQWQQHDRFALVANGICHEQDIPSGAEPGAPKDYLSLTIVLDPRLIVTGYILPRVVLAQDEIGSSFVPPDPAPDSAACPAGSWGMFDLHVPLHYPARHGGTMVRLRGLITLRIATKIETVKIPDVAKAVGMTRIVGNHKLELQEFSFDGRAGKLRTRITDLAPPGAADVISSATPDAIEQFDANGLVDAAGIPACFADGTLGHSRRQMAFATIFMGPPEHRILQPPFSMRWEVVTETKDVVVPFEFDNLPLP